MHTNLALVRRHNLSKIKLSEYWWVGLLQATGVAGGDFIPCVEPSAEAKGLRCRYKIGFFAIIMTLTRYPVTVIDAMPGMPQ